MTIKTKLLALSLLYGLLPIVVMLAAANQAGFGLQREFHTTMAMALMVTVLVCLVSPGLIRYWLFSSQIKQIKEFCRQVKAGNYQVHLSVPNEVGHDGSQNELVDLMRDMNWMVHTIRVNESELKQAVSSLAQSKAEIQAQKHELETINEKQRQIQLQLEGRTQELAEAVDKIRNLLDNAGQGFLSFGEDLIVAGEYSAECVMIFNQEISAAWVPGLLQPGDREQQAFLATLLTKIFAEKNIFLRDNYLSLLPEEVVLDGSYIRLTYKWITQPADPKRQEILLILTDITKQRVMEKKMEQEKNMLAMIVKAVTHYGEFKKSIAEYRLFCRQELPALITAKEPMLGKVHTIFRAIHTWKGTFGQLGIYRLAARLHELESALAKLREEAAQDIESAELTACFTRYSPETLYDWLEQEVSELKLILGENFFLAEDTIVIESGKLQELEEKIARLLVPCQARALIAELHKLRYKPFPDLLSIYQDYLADAAKNHGKQMYSLQFAGPKITVDPERYHDFIKCLVHVFRNAVAHGLETPEERLAAGKDTYGQILCHIEEQGDELVIGICDDGRGIDAQAVRKHAAAKGLVSSQAAAALADQEALHLIFADGYSSAAACDELAGRGVGLSAVEQEVKKLGGRIEVRTQVGKGTRFSFILPHIDTAAEALEVLTYI